MLKFAWIPVFLLVLPLTGLQIGQYPPGQYPTPYPGTQNPNDPNQGNGPFPGGGVSIPSRSHKKNQKKTEQQQPTIEADGVTLSNDGKKLQVGTEDGRVLTMSLTPETKWTRAGNAIAANLFVSRTTVHIAASEDDEAYLTAVSVDLKKDAPREEPEVPASNGAGTAAKPATTATAAEDEEMARPTILKAPDAPGRPVLRHGKPSASDSTASASSTDSDEETKPVSKSTTATATSKKSDSGAIDFTLDDKPAPVKHVNKYDDLLDKTHEWAATFTDGLPNFLCQQSTTRYVEQSRSEGFQPVDVVTAKVLYEEGREKYSDIAVGGKKTSKSMMEIGGSTSTGEFASVLGGLFVEGTRAEFKFFQSATVGKEPAAIYDFKVPLRNSNWTIVVGGQLLRPAYSGSIWVDKATAQVRRIEMQADNVPKDFPEDAIASAVDYEEVPLGTNKFLLPVHAENLSCQRGSSICSKNTIDFRDYHKYSGESTIEFK